MGSAAIFNKEVSRAFTHQARNRVFQEVILHEEECAKILHKKDEVVAGRGMDRSRAIVLMTVTCK